MIRFLPDTWRDALWRPVAMAAPDAGVYVEIMAPDIRFALLCMLLLWALVAWRTRRRLTPVALLIVFSVSAFAVWLLTTGNGRYFIPILLAVGPLCIALIYRLPFTRNLRLFAAATVLALQSFVLMESNPWRWWGLAPWTNAPFFQIELDPQAATVPATYVTATSISYSLVAPKFPPQSRWVNISSQPDPDKNPDGKRLQAVLASSTSLQLLIPSMPDHMRPGGQPNDALTKVINELLNRQKLALADPLRCRLLPSRGLASQAFRSLDAVQPKVLAKMGFWVCPLRYPVPVNDLGAGEGSARVNHAFEVVEKICPRFFPPGQARTGKMEGGFVRGYSDADMKLYAFDDEKVFYRYWRALNPVFIGTINQLLANEIEMDCTAIRGRSGLPWERQL